MKFAVDPKLAMGVNVFCGSVTIFVAVYESGSPNEFFGCQSAHTNYVRSLRVSSHPENPEPRKSYSITQ